MVQLSATRCSCIAFLCVSLVSFATITLCIASQRVFTVVSIYFVIGSVRKLLDTPSYVISHCVSMTLLFVPTITSEPVDGYVMKFCMNIMTLDATPITS
jgi:hypothetical protein